MKDKKIIIGVAVVAFIVMVVVLPKTGMLKKKEIKKTPVTAPVKDKAKAKVPAKKPISKDKGGLTVAISGTNNKPLALRVKVFKVIDNNSSLYSGSITSNRMGELNPGNYDIEIDALPAVIIKGIKVSKGEETIKDIGAFTGSLMVKAMNVKKKPAGINIQIIEPATSMLVATTATNRPIEVVPGIYDLKIETVPSRTMKGVKIESGKENLVDIGCPTGTLIVQETDASGKELRHAVKVRQKGKAEIITSSSTNRPFDLLEGDYEIEVIAATPQAKKEVMIKAGEEARLEMSPPAAAPVAATITETKPVKK